MLLSTHAYLREDPQVSHQRQKAQVTQEEKECRAPARPYNPVGAQTGPLLRPETRTKNNVRSESTHKKKYSRLSWARLSLGADLVHEVCERVNRDTR